MRFRDQLVNLGTTAAITAAILNPFSKAEASSGSQAAQRAIESVQGARMELAQAAVVEIDNDTPVGAEVVDAPEAPLEGADSPTVPAEGTVVPTDSAKSVGTEVKS